MPAAEGAIRVPAGSPAGYGSLEHVPGTWAPCFRPQNLPSWSFTGLVAQREGPGMGRRVGGHPSCMWSPETRPPIPVGRAEVSPEQPPLPLHGVSAGRVSACPEASRPGHSQVGKGLNLEATSGPAGPVLWLLWGQPGVFLGLLLSGGPGSLHQGYSAPQWVDSGGFLVPWGVPDSEVSHVQGCPGFRTVPDSG